MKRIKNVFIIMIVSLFLLPILIVRETGMFDRLTVSEIRLGYDTKNCYEGLFLDTNGNNITQRNETKYAECLYTSYANIIGYNSPKYGKSLLRARYRNYLYDPDENWEGNNITLTTDNRLQDFLYNNICEDDGSVIVMDSSGAILGFASKSVVELDLNNLDSYMEKALKIDASMFQRGTVYENHSAGSVMKPITLYSALASTNGKITDAYTYNDEGVFISSNGTKLFNWAKREYGLIDYVEALKVSSNAYFANLAVNTVGASQLLKTANEFFLYNQEIELDFTTIKSTFALSDYSNDALIASNAIGQGKTTTSPLHLCMIVNALSNGDFVKPYLIKSIDTASGKNVYKTKTETISKLNSDYTKIIKEALSETADSYGLSSKYDIIAKTGTADTPIGVRTSIMVSTGEYSIVINRNNSGNNSKELANEAQKIIDFLEKNLGIY